MQGPDLTGNERFGVSANWGNFDGEKRGMGPIGVVTDNMGGGRFAITGGRVSRDDENNLTTTASSAAVAPANTWGAAWWSVDVGTQGRRLRSPD
jgi:hypothetical protein